MKLPSLFKTTAIRLTIRYVLVYALVMGVALGSLLFLTNHYVNSNVRTTLEKQLQSIKKHYETAGIESAKASSEAILRQPDQQELFLILLSNKGSILAGNLKGWPKEAEIDTDSKVQNIWLEDNIVPLELDDDEVFWPVIATEFKDGSHLLIAHRVQQIKELHELTEFLLQSLSMAIALSLLMGIILSRAILSRIKHISSTASDIMAGDLRQRVMVSTRNDEFDALAHQLNAMLDRIQRLISGIREVTDNVAHDLRSPLTRLRNRLEITLLEARSKQDYRKVIEQAMEDTDSLISTFNALLRIAQVESGNHREDWALFDLDKLVTDLVDIYQPLAEEKHQSLDTVCQRPIEIFGNTDLIAQMLSNLLENAIKYTPEKGKIHLEVKQLETVIEIIISDSGPGIAQAERAHVLERFVRLENSRNSPGNGLGLSLVQATCKLHNADLILDDAQPGLRVKIRIPYIGNIEVRGQT